MLFIVTITAMRIVWITVQSSPAHEGAIQGQYDLRGWDMQSSRPVLLNGEWLFYPGELLAYGKEARQQPHSIQVPGKWTAADFDLGADRYYGTYRLVIRLDEPVPDELSLRIMGISTSSAVYVNGEQVGASGQVADTKADSSMWNVPYTVHFSTTTSELDVMVHVSNYEFYRGGITDWIKFGTRVAIERATDFSILMRQIFVALALFHAVYVGILFLLGIRGKGLLQFLLLLICTIVMTLLTDDKMLYAYLTNYELAFKLNFVMLQSISILLLMFASTMLPEHAFPRTSQLFYLYTTVYILLIILVPLAHLDVILRLYYVGALGMPLLIMMMMYRAVRSGESGIIYLLLGGTAICLNIVWSGVKSANVLEMYFYPVDLTIAFFSLAAYWFKSYFKTNEQLARAANELQLADKQKDAFLVNTSHELKNPLHGMMNMTRSVLESVDSQLSDADRAKMTLVMDVGKRMSLLLNDLLDFDRLRENSIQLQFAAVPLKPVASGVCDMLRYLTRGKAVQIVNEIADDFPRVKADENRLVQILFNLVHNAVKYTEAGTVSMHARTDGDMAVVTVKDTGIGIDSGLQQRIFRPYAQIDASATAVGGGIGLGLSIVAELVHIHQGTMKVESSPGQGSTFSFTLPLAGKAEGLDTAKQLSQTVQSVQSAQLVQSTNEGQIAPLFDEAAAAQLIDRKVSSGDGANRLNILAVDDDTVNLNVLVSLLSWIDGVSVFTASNGEEALSMMDSRSWDLIVVDVMMPRMSGYELTSIIRQSYTLFELPILLLTARNRPEDIEAGFSAGANDYVAKPVDAGELRARAMALVKMKSAVHARVDMEAAWLQAQIQPHFLFNALGAIAALSEIDIERMRQLLDAFGDYLRSSFSFQNADRVVPLSQELDLVNAYLYIEQERFQERLEIFKEIESIPGLYIPPLTIQPLVENAIRHGILKKTEGGRVTIRIRRIGEEAEITVADNGVGMDEAKLKSLLDSREEHRRGIGVLNTERRLRQLYGSGLQIHSTPGTGTRFTFRVKIGE